MARASVLLVFASLVVPALADEPAQPFQEGGFQALVPENLLGPVAYGDSGQFWEAHALVIGTVEEARLEYDQEKLVAREHLGIRVKKSIPDRYAHDRRLLTKVVERPVVAYDRPAEPPPPRYRVGDALMLMVFSGKRELDKREFGSFAMMPGGYEVCVVEKGKSPLVAQTWRLCKALATADLAKRLTRIDLLLKESPDERAKLVLQRRLASTIQELQGRLQEAQQLAQKASQAEPRQPPSVRTAKENSMSGIVTVTSGRVVVLQEEELFSVNKDTQFFRETGRDPAETTAQMLVPGTAVMAVGGKDEDGEFVAARVYALLGNVLRGPPFRPDPAK